MDILLLLFMIILTLLQGNFYSSMGVQGYHFSQYGDILIFADVIYLINLIVFFNLFYYTRVSLKLFSDEKKRLSISFLSRFYLYLAVVAIFLFSGVIFFYLSGYSASYLPFLGFRFYVYPSFVGYSMLLGFAVSIHLFLFGYNEYRKSISNREYAVALIMLTVSLIVTIFPQNYYGVFTPKGVLDLRPLTNLLLMLYYMFTIYFVVSAIRKKIKNQKDKVLATRLKLTEYGFLALVGFFVFYFLDAVTGGGKPFTYWMIPAFLSFTTGGLLIYLGFLTPKWLEKFLSK